MQYRERTSVMVGQTGFVIPAICYVDASFEEEVQDAGCLEMYLNDLFGPIQAIGPILDSQDGIDDYLVFVERQEISGLPLMYMWAFMEDARGFSYRKVKEIRCYLDGKLLGTTSLEELSIDQLVVVGIEHTLLVQVHRSGEDLGFYAHCCSVELPKYLQAPVGA